MTGCYPIAILIDIAIGSNPVTFVIFLGKILLGDQLICSLYTLPHIKPEYQSDCRGGAHEKVVWEGFSGVINRSIQKVR